MYKPTPEIDFFTDDISQSPLADPEIIQEFLWGGGGD